MRGELRLIAPIVLVMVALMADDVRTVAQMIVLLAMWAIFESVWRK